MQLTERTPLHVPQFHFYQENSITYALDGDAPNWIAVEERGAEIIRTIAAGPITFGALVAQYASSHTLEAGKAWLHVHDFVAALDRAQLISDQPFEREPYGGRSEYIKPDGLREIWIQINNACNLTCA